ncbi:MAG: TldD/PmbA family protein [Candidatus Methanofastidiosia archaeon]
MKFDTLKDELLEIALKGLKYAKSQGARETEIFVSSFSSSQATIQQGMVDASDGISEGIGVRIADSKKLGFASATGLSEDSLKFAVREALSVTRTVDEKNVKFEGFAVPRKGGREGILDESLLEMGGEDIVSNVEEIFSEANQYDKRVVSVTGQVSLSHGGFAVSNTEGVERATRITSAVYIIYITALENSKRKTALDFIVSRKKPEFQGLGENGARKAIAMLESKSLKTSEKLTTLWDPLTASQFLSTALASSINGRSVVEGRSAFADKIGDRVGVRELNVRDDGQILESVSTSSVDFEGTPRQNTSIIRKGVLKSFIFDDYYAKVFGTQSTGNANRSSQAPYESSPRIGTTTLVLEPGSKKREEMISEIDKGVLLTDILMGMGHANQISGDFSIVCTNPYLVDKGELKGALEPVTIAGNMYKSFEQLREIGSDALLTPFAFTPSLCFEDFTVSG